MYQCHGLIPIKWGKSPVLHWHVVGYQWIHVCKALITVSAHTKYPINVSYYYYHFLSWLLFLRNYLTTCILFTAMCYCYFSIVSVICQDIWFQTLTIPLQKYLIGKPSVKNIFPVLNSSISLFASLSFHFHKPLYFIPIFDKYIQPATLFCNSLLKVIVFQLKKKRKVNKFLPSFFLPSEVNTRSWL